MTIHRPIVAAAIAFAVGSFAPAAHAADAEPGYVRDAIHEPHPIRIPTDQVQDATRNPDGVMTFAGIKPGQVVADFIAGDGYYTRILSKIVGPKGKVYAIVPMSRRSDFESQIAESKNRVQHGGEALASPADPPLSVQNATPYNNVVVLMYQLGAYGGQFSVPEQLDAVFTADRYHELHNPGYDVADKMPAVTKALFDSLKPGGSYVVVDYAAAPGAGFAKTESLSRSDAGAVKAEILGAGFVLAAESNALTVAGDDENAPVPQSGKASRLALRFQKPADASGQTKRPGPHAMDGYFGNTEISGTKSPNPRWVMYNPDFSYLEMGNPGASAVNRGGDVQVGTWYWDAAGHNCMIHQYPAEERGFVVCHADTGQPNRKLGEVWTLPGSTRDFGIYAGRKYPRFYGIDLSAKPTVAGEPAYVADAIHEPQPIRIPGDVMQDGARKPDAVFTFAGIKPGQVVADFVAGDGYYTRILSKIVGANGRVYAIVPMTWQNDHESMLAENKRLVAAGVPPLPVSNDPLLAIQNVDAYSNVVALMYRLKSYGGQFSVPEQLDAVFTADQYHELHNPGYAVDDKMPVVTKAIFLALKPGGTYTVIDYAAAKGTGFTKTETLKRSDPDAVKAEILAAGFVLGGESDALAIPSDDLTFPLTDPGKASRFALRFKKPANAALATMRPGTHAMDGYYGNTELSGIGTAHSRWVMYHPDGSYLEMGNPGAEAAGRGDDTQVGTWYWDALGHNCMIHQWPADERGFIVCHNNTGQPGKKLGDTWIVGANQLTLLPGYQYPLAYGLNK